MVAPSAGPSIRVMLLSSTVGLIDNMRVQMADLFPIRMVEVATSGRQGRATLRDVAPDVILIAEGLEDVPALELAKEIAVASPATGVVLLARDETVDYYRRAIASGARGVVPLIESPQGMTVQSIELLSRAITQAYEFSRRTVKAVDRTDQKKVIVLYSPKGGVGVTTSALNLAATLAVLSPAKRVAYLDLNLQFGTSALFFGQTQGPSTVDVALASEDSGRQTLETSLAKRELAGNTILHAIPAPRNPREADAVSETQVRAMLAALRRGFDLVVIDTPCVVSDLTLAALQAADQIVFVTTLDALAVAETRVALRFLADPDLGVMARELHLLVIASGETGRSPVIRRQDLEELLGIPILGHLPSDEPYVATRMAAGEFLLDKDWTHPIAKALRAIGEGLMARVSR